MAYPQMPMLSGPQNPQADSMQWLQQMLQGQPQQPQPMVSQPSYSGGTPVLGFQQQDAGPQMAAGQDWGKRLQNAPDDQALIRIIRQMIQQGITPPAEFIPPGYTPRGKG